MIRFPDPAQKKFTEHMSGVLDALDELLIERFAQVGLRIDAEEPDVDPSQIDGAIKIGLSFAAEKEFEAISAEVINLAQEFHDDEIERSFEEAGQAIAIQPELEDTDTKRFEKIMTRNAGDLVENHLEFVREELTEAVKKGRRAEEIAETFAERAEISRDKAELWARDTLGSFNAFQTQKKMSDLGVKKYRWRTSQDERVRDTHAALHGTVQRWDQPPLPGHPGEDHMCRCTSLPIIPGTKGMDEPVGGVRRPEELSTARQERLAA